ncbi:hypothetical protein J6590_027945 [Homalodisca vitripennis]|nr:hypothetical protein J6590_027945 [Homalodisca vitripennis]
MWGREVGEICPTDKPVLRADAAPFSVSDCTINPCGKCTLYGADRAACRLSSGHRDPAERDALSTVLIRLRIRRVNSGRKATLAAGTTESGG